MDNHYEIIKNKLIAFTNQQSFDINKRGSTIGLIRYIENEITEASQYTSLKNLIDTINADNEININLNYKSVFYAFNKIRTHKNDSNKTHLEKKPSTTTIEKSDNSSIDFSKFRNLNKLSKKLITDHNLTLEDLNEIGIRGIADDMTVYEKINRFCEKKVSQAKRKEYAHLLKKD